MAARLARGFANDHTLMADVTFTAVLQPAPACYPPDVNALAQLLATFMLKGTLPDNSGGGVFVGSIQPSSSITQKVWFQIDAAGRPIGIRMFYNGNWRLLYTGSVGDVKPYARSLSGLVDGTGKGIMSGSLDGWALCDGRNGTPNLVNQFVVCADNITNLTTNVNPSSPNSRQGGAATHVIGRTNLPNMVARLLKKSFSFVHGGEGGEELYKAATTADDWPIVQQNTGLPVGGSAPVNHVPPYYSLMYLMFIGYA
jgi:hypothetical protein